MKSNRTRSVLLNLVTNFANQIVLIIGSLLMTPLFISFYGSDVNGLIASIKSLMGYVQLIGAGISEASTVALYEPVLLGNTEKISQIYKATRIAFFRAGLFFVLFSTGLSFAYPLLITLDRSYFYLVGIVYIISITGASELLGMGKYRTLMIADQKLYVINTIQMFGSMANAVVTITLIRLEVNLILVLFFSSLVYIMRVFLMTLYWKKHYAYINENVVADFQAISKRKYALVHQLSGLVVFSSQTIIISVFVGLSEASLYAVYNIVFSGISTLTGTISSALLAAFGQLVSTKNYRKILEAYKQYELAYFSIIFTVYTVCALLIIPFISIYTKSSTDFNYIRSDVALLFIVMGVLNSIRTPGATLINAYGLYKETTGRALTEMTICLILQLVLVGKFGILGVLIGSSIAYAYRTTDVIVYSNKKILSRSSLSTFIRIGISLLSMIILYIVLKNTNYQVLNYIHFIKYGFIFSSVTFSFIITVYYIFYTKEVSSLMHRFKDAFSRKSK